MRGLLAAGLASACAGSTAGPLPTTRVAWRYRTTDGDYGSLASWRGRPPLVHVLATWSAPALLELPMLRDLHRTGQIQVLGVVVDREEATAEILADSFQLGYPVVRPADLPRFLGEEGPFGALPILPTSFVLDAEGRLLARNEGTWQPATLRRLVQKIEGPKASE